MVNASFYFSMHVRVSSTSGIFLPLIGQLDPLDQILPHLDLQTDA